MSALALRLRSTRTPALRLGARMYHQNIVDHYESPRNVGSLDKEDPNVGTGLVGAPACGDVMKLQMRVGKDGKVEEAVFKTFGCGSAIASSSFTTEWLKGKDLNECGEIKNSIIAQHLKLPPVKLHCSMLAEDAVKAAIKDYQEKQAALTGSGTTAEATPG
uniref:Iron-sulfur cluster assembly protein n=1 Tax=Coccolithus braarudii TaxID=221442 RepID=A0A7S0Q4A0_9EUKA|eukprot:CAMPEP_0183337218 /NCGR_PEP_ID=MMETSP0164_2-20130417/4952_1 /TAXON_ID=221442 /ORGANISM="Coccolithus pelagicus ssp braarudi, Strain PLY182g" /LENGTH=160 /DNA_ID=CAMNT_0025506885 /DNA_START=36 /DNA_END=518 /DNA_ORIENTATION=-